jgi:hypothetical protein
LQAKSNEVVAKKKLSNHWLAQVYFLLQQGALSAKCGSIASEKQRSCSEKETEQAMVT